MKKIILTLTVIITILCLSVFTISCSLQDEDYTNNSSSETSEDSSPSSEDSETSEGSSSSSEDSESSSSDNNQNDSSLEDNSSNDIHGPIIPVG